MKGFRTLEHFNVVYDVLSGFISTLIVCEKYPLNFRVAKKLSATELSQQLPFRLMLLIFPKIYFSNNLLVEIILTASLLQALSPEWPIPAAH